MGRDIKLATFAEAHGLDVGRLRRAAQKGEVVGAVQMFGKGGPWGIDEDAPIPDLGEPGQRASDDGLHRFIVRMDPARVVEFEAMGLIVVKDATATGKAHRATKRAAKAALKAAAEAEAKAEAAKNAPQTHADVMDAIGVDIVDVHADADAR